MSRFYARFTRAIFNESVKTILFDSPLSLLNRNFNSVLRSRFPLPDMISDIRHRWTLPLFMARLKIITRAHKRFIQPYHREFYIYNRICNRANSNFNYPKIIVITIIALIIIIISLSRRPFSFFFFFSILPVFSLPTINKLFYVLKLIFRRQNFSKLGEI